MRINHFVQLGLIALLATVNQVPSSATTGQLACSKAGMTSSASAVLSQDSATQAQASDYTYAASDITAVALNGTITITKAGTYRLTGTMTNGQVIVNVNGNGIVRLLLANANVTSKVGAAIDVKAAPKVVVMALPGTVNVLTDAATRKNSDKSTAAVFSKAPLSIAGTGMLRINGKFNDAIGGTDGVVIAGGTLQLAAADDGIHGKDFVTVEKATISMNVGGDGIRSAGTKSNAFGYVAISSGTVTVTARGDALQGLSDVVIGGGTLKLAAGGSAITSSCVTYFDKATATIAAGNDALHSDGETVVRGGVINVSKAYEGIEGANVVISGGQISLITSDDGINGAGGVDSSSMQGPGQQQKSTAKTEVYSNTLTNHFQLDGGKVVVNALGDGVDINGSAEITGGLLVVSGPTANNNGALDVDTTFNITGGTVIAVGSSGMAVAPATSSPQASLMGNFASTQAANTILHVVDSSGHVIASFKSPKTYQSIVFSSSEVVKGKAYKIYLGGTMGGTTTGYYATGGSIDGATLYGSVTAGSYTNQGPGGAPRA